MGGEGRLTIRPTTEVQFGLPAGCMSIDDLFVAKYEPSGQRGLGPHEDGSTWSFVVALNAGDGTAVVPPGREEAEVEAEAEAEALVKKGEGAFAGGGTRFELLPGRPVFRPGGSCPPPPIPRGLVRHPRNG